MAEAPDRPIIKRSVLVAGHSTSISIEEPFWIGLREMASERGLSVNGLVASIDSHRKGQNLSSAIRVAVLNHYRRLAGDHGAEG